MALFSHGLMLAMTTVTLAAFACWFFIRPLFALAAPKSSTPKERIDISGFAGVSVVVPCHNESETIEAVAKSILASDLDCPMELILVENNSTDNTLEVINRLAAQDSRILPLSKVTPAGKNPISHSINYGIQHAKYEHIVRMDADTLVAKNSIRELVSVLARPEVSTAASNVRISNPDDNLLTKLQTLDYFIAMELERRASASYNSLLCCSGAFQTFRKSQLQPLGGYLENKDIGEDLELTIKMHQVGKVPFASSAICYTDVPNTLKAWFHQRIWWYKIGLVTAYIHRDKLFHKQGHRRSMIGFIGLPNMVFENLYWIAAMFVGTVIMFSMSGQFDLMLFIKATVFSYLGLFGLNVFAFTITAIKAENKQGLDRWYLLPIHFFGYESMMMVVRLVGTYEGIKAIKKQLKPKYEPRHLRVPEPRAHSTA